jgi:hypothetical protein
MVGADYLRPGASSYRVFPEDVPIWSVVGDLLAQGWNGGDADDQRAIAEAVAADWNISLDAIAAAILYYQEHRDVIDEVLAKNEAERRWRGPLVAVS